MRTKLTHRDALNLAYSMLFVIEKGGSFSAEAWRERMVLLETSLGAGVWPARRVAEMDLSGDELDRPLGEKK